MKQIFIILGVVLFNMPLMGQEKTTKDMPKDILDCLPEMGKDVTSTLNVCESKFLNFCFQKDRGDFNFCGKKMAFLEGNIGTIASTKAKYFATEKRLIHEDIYPIPRGQLIVFNKAEAKETGYDAVFISYNKKGNITSSKAVKRLKKAFPARSKR
jgi:hypothetical protein